MMCFRLAQTAALIDKQRFAVHFFQQRRPPMLGRRGRTINQFRSFIAHIYLLPGPSRRRRRASRGQSCKFVSVAQGGATASTRASTAAIENECLRAMPRADGPSSSHGRAARTIVVAAGGGPSCGSRGPRAAVTARKTREEEMIPLFSSSRNVRGGACRLWKEGAFALKPHRGCLSPRPAMPLSS